MACPSVPCRVTADDSVALWDCPCRECTRMDYECRVSLDGPLPGGLAAWRSAMFPEVYV